MKVGKAFPGGSGRDAGGGELSGAGLDMQRPWGETAPETSALQASMEE